MGFSKGNPMDFLCMDFLKENAGYTNLEYRTSFTLEELEAVKIKFNLSEE